MDDVKALVNYGWGTNTSVFSVCNEENDMETERVRSTPFSTDRRTWGFLVLPFQRNILKILGENIFFNSIRKLGGRRRNKEAVLNVRKNVIG